MPDEVLKTFRRLVNETLRLLKAEKIPAKREELEHTLVSRRMDLERYLRSRRLQDTDVV
jgi:hypothetical protein